MSELYKAYKAWQSLEETRKECLGDMLVNIRVRLFSLPYVETKTRRRSLFGTRKTD